MSDGAASTSGTEGEEAPHSSLFIAHEVLHASFSKCTNQTLLEVDLYVRWHHGIATLAFDGFPSSTGGCG